MEEFQSAINLAHQLEDKFDKWEISSKIMIVVTNNEKNVVNSLMNISETYDLTCTAHSIQLCGQQWIVTKWRLYTHSVE